MLRDIDGVLLQPRAAARRNIKWSPQGREYDETGNCRSYSHQSPTALSQVRTHNRANEITSIVSTPSPAASVYDAVGNMTTMPSPNAWATAYTCKWDAWNRLVQVVQSGSEVAAYRYDAITRRIVKAVDEQSYHFYYDREWRALEERLEGAVKSQYVWSPFDRWNLIRRQRVTSGTTFNETYYVLRDYLDPVAIVDEDGIVTERYRYDAFGPATKLNPTFTTPSTSDADWNWLFHGKFDDPETTFYNYGYRSYYPKLGRWISRDPLREQSALNLYQFVRNRASGSRDILGLEDCKLGATRIDLRSLEVIRYSGNLTDVKALASLGADNLLKGLHYNSLKLPGQQ